MSRCVRAPWIVTLAATRAIAGQTFHRSEIILNECLETVVSVVFNLSYCRLVESRAPGFYLKARVISLPLEKAAVDSNRRSNRQSLFVF